MPLGWYTKKVVILQKKDHIQGWVRDLCSAQIPVCICAHCTCYTWPSEKHLSATNIWGEGWKWAFSASEGNSCSVHEFIFIMAHLENILLPIFCPEAPTQHLLTAFQHRTFSTCLMRDPTSTKTQQLALHAISLANKGSAASSGMQVWIQFFLLLSHTEALDQHNSINLSSWWSHPGLGIQGLLPHLASHHRVGP